MPLRKPPGDDAGKPQRLNLYLKPPERKLLEDQIARSGRAERRPSASAHVAELLRKAEEAWVQAGRPPEAESPKPGRKTVRMPEAGVHRAEDYEAGVPVTRPWRRGQSTDLPELRCYHEAIARAQAQGCLVAGDQTGPESHDQYWHYIEVIFQAKEQAQDRGCFDRPFANAITEGYEGKVSRARPPRRGRSAPPGAEHYWCDPEALFQAQAQADARGEIVRTLDEAIASIWWVARLFGWPITDDADVIAQGWRRVAGSIFSWAREVAPEPGYSRFRKFVVRCEDEFVAVYQRRDEAGGRSAQMMMA